MLSLLSLVTNDIAITSLTSRGSVRVPEGFRGAAFYEIQKARLRYLLKTKSTAITKGTIN